MSLSHSKSLLIAVTFLPIVFCSSSPAPAQFGGGSGDPNNPYLIATASQLLDLTNDPNYWNSSFRLSDHIDLSDYSLGSIGNASYPFTGRFDGNGKLIYDLALSAGNQNDVGLFGVVEGPGALIENLGLVRPTIAAASGHSICVWMTPRISCIGVSTTIIPRLAEFVA